MKLPQTYVKRSRMDSLALLQKLYPIEIPYQDSINLQLMTWIARKGLLQMETVNDKEYLLSLFKFAPRLMPFASPRMQLLSAKLFTVLFLMDDSADVYQGNYWLDTWNAHLNPRLKSEQSPDHIRIAMEAIQLLNLHQNIGGQKNMVSLFKQYIYAGIEERCKWEDKGIPDLDCYLAFKMNTSGIGMAFECLQIAHPEVSSQIPFGLLDEIKAKIASLVILSNDLNSYPKELQNGDLNNLVILYHLKSGMSISSAVRKVKKILKNHLEELDAIAKQEIGINTSNTPNETTPCPYQISYSNDFLSGFQKFYALYVGCRFWALNDTARYHKSKSHGN